MAELPANPEILDLGELKTLQEVKDFLIAQREKFIEIEDITNTLVTLEALEISMGPKAQIRLLRTITNQSGLREKVTEIILAKVFNTTVHLGELSLLIDNYDELLKDPDLASTSQIIQQIIQNPLRADQLVNVVSDKFGLQDKIRALVEETGRRVPVSPEE